MKSTIFFLLKVRQKSFWICFFAVILVCFTTLPYQVNAEEKETLKVGFPIQYGLSEVDENGDYKGYTYEYLQEIAQYTGWEYEFVRIEGKSNEILLKMFSMLETGELDVLGGVVHNEELEKVYDYPGNSYGVSYTTLCVSRDNRAINEFNYMTIQPLRIAVMKKAVNRNMQLQKFCDTSGVTPELIYFDTYEECVEAVKSGTADATISVDLSYTEGMRTIAQFATEPYYFAVTKGKANIASRLNSAIMRINDVDPYFQSHLYNKYFGEQYMDLNLSEDEKQYISELGVLNVGMDDGKGPIQYKEANGMKGISPDILKYISEQTGLKFNIISADSQQELNQLVETEKVDLITGVNYNYNSAKSLNLSLSRPYLSSQVLMAVNDKVETKDNMSNKKLALVKGENEEELVTNNAVYFDTVEECMEAVESGQADYCYGDSYILQYYANVSLYKNVSLIPQEENQQDLCIAIRKPSDARLMSVINKSVRSISDKKMQEIIYKNILPPEETITIFKWMDSNPRQAILVFVFVMFLLSGVAGIFVYNRLKLGRRIIMDNKRYEQLSELSNEYFFEYNYTTDQMLLSELCSQVFGMDRTLNHFIESLSTSKDEKAAIKMDFYEKLTQNREEISDMYLKLAEGGYRWFRITAKVVEDNIGNPIYVIGKIADIQDEKAEKAYLIQKAQQDGLTKIYNAATAHMMVRNLLASFDSNETSALFIMDLDRFKSINDQLGHYVGDQVLQETAQILKSTFRADDVIGRLGGDEFMIFMQKAVSFEVVETRCESLLKKMKQMKAGDGKMDISLSIGVVLSEGKKDYPELYQRADAALYTVKNGGRNNYKIVS